MDLCSSNFNNATYNNGNPKEMMIIAEGIYKMSIVLDKEIQFTAMIASLKGLA